MPIDASVSRQVIHDHLAACRPCRELLAYSRRAADREALVAWRQQLAVHLEPFPSIPYAGAKQSGIGTELGQEGLEEFTQTTIINVANDA